MVVVVAVAQDLIALLAYEKPEESPVKQYLQPERRLEAAQALNKLLLCTHALALSALSMLEGESQS